jgi:hypothetical protein
MRTPGPRPTASDPGAALAPTWRGAAGDGAPGGPAALAGGAQPAPPTFLAGGDVGRAGLAGKTSAAGILAESGGRHREASGGIEESMDREGGEGVHRSVRNGGR